MNSGWLKTPISYYGGKLNLVDKILPLLDYNKKEFVSLFTGGGAIEMAKRRHEVEVWNDLDDRVITFWEVLQDDKEFEELTKYIKMTLHAETYHTRAKVILLNPKKFDRVKRAWAFWVQCNMSFGNSIFNGFAFAHDNSRNNMTRNKREDWSKIFYERVKMIQLFNRDAIEMINLKDSPDTFFFADPPYVSSECGHYAGVYSEMDFIHLLDKLSRIQGTFLLTSYPEDILMKYRLKHGWTYEDEKMPLAVSGKREETKYKTECITYNYKIQQTLDLSFD